MVTPAQPVSKPSASGWRDRLAVIGDECGYSSADQISNAKALGLASIELRSIAGRSLATLTRADVDAMALSLQDAGLGVVALDSPLGAGRVDGTTLQEDLATAERWLELAGVLGAPSVRVMSYAQGDMAEAAWREDSVRRLLALRELAERFDKRLLHENCVGWGGLDPKSAGLLMDEVGSEHLGFLMDTGNGVWYGYDSVDMAEAVLPHIRHVHIKDAVSQEGVAEPCLPGVGAGRVAQTLAVVLRRYADMTLSLEPHLLVQPHLGIQCQDSEALRTSVARCMEELALVMEQTDEADGKQP